MHHSHEKGTTVKPTEHNAKPASTPKTGPFALLRGLPRVGGSSAHEVAGVAAVIVAMLAFFPARVLASGPPTFGQGSLNQETHSTRIRMKLELIHMETLETQWRVEYSTSKAVVEKGEGIVTNSGVVAPGGALSDNLYLELGNNKSDATVGLGFGWTLRYLKAETVYYARFFAKNKEGEVAEIVPFKTLPVGKPEIPLRTVYTGDNDETTFLVAADAPTSAAVTAQVETNGAETGYRIEYAPAELNGQAPPPGSLAWQTCSSGATGTVSVAEDYAQPKGRCAGLTPETKYFARVRATNAKGSIEELQPFTTLTAKGIVETPIVRNVTGVSAHLVDGVVPHGSETHWRFQVSTEPGNAASWKSVPGAAGTISQAQVEALPKFGDAVTVDGQISGLAPSTVYSVRLFAENAAGEDEACHTLPAGPGQPVSELVCEPISTATYQKAASFRTDGPPTVATSEYHAFVAGSETLRLLGEVNPNSTPTSAEQSIKIEGAPTGGTFTLTFEGHTSAPIPYNASAAQVAVALGLNEAAVTGSPGGPYTVYFGWQGNPSAEKSVPQIEANPSGLTPAGVTISATTTQQGGLAYDTHYHFEYEGEKETGAPFAHAASTPSADPGSGSSSEGVGASLPGLTTGETYRYRLSAVNTSPGEPVVHGAESTLTVPTPAGESSAKCPNEAVRTGPSANLPDCRAYEQLTPVDKEGAQEIFSYGTSVSSGVFALPGEDGDHLMLQAQYTNWGSGPTAGHSPYFFSRTATGWQMTAASAEPELGVDTLTAEVFDPNLGRFGFASDYGTSESRKSPAIEFKVGPPGGPYLTVASVPRKQVGKLGISDAGWVAASADFSKLILKVEDRNLVEPATTTKTGFDLYEYSGGALRQANVGTGTCGAKIVRGREADFPAGRQVQPDASGSHSVSADGSRVFFEAAPASNCSEPSHLYIRVNGTETVDVGAYEFVEGDVEGATLLVSHDGALFRYDTAVGSIAPVPAGESLSPSRYTYTKGVAYAWEFGTKADLGEPQEPGSHDQVIRYDSVEHVVECVSCSSPFAPEPWWGAYLSTTEGRFSVHGGLPDIGTVAANGAFAFFSTPVALVPQDVDGAVTPEGGVSKGEYESDSDISLSSDIYEWRANGVNGCAHVQGCVALITNGRGGYQNILLGSADEGRDVFIYTRSQLVPRDTDNAGDIYDVRIGGGFAPPPPAPTECEASACSNPASAPNDATPSSSTFAGAGNLVPSFASTSPPPVVKCRKGTRRVHSRCVKVKPRRQAKARSRHARSGRQRRGRS